MIDIYDDDVHDVLLAARTRSGIEGEDLTTSDYLLQALVDRSELVRSILTRLGVDVNDMIQALEKKLTELPPRGRTGLPDLSASARQVLRGGIAEATRRGAERVTVSDLLIGVVRLVSSSAAKIVSAYDLVVADLRSEAPSVNASPGTSVAMRKAIARAEAKQERDSDRLSIETLLIESLEIDSWLHKVLKTLDVSVEQVVRDLDEVTRKDHRTEVQRRAEYESVRMLSIALSRDSLHPEHPIHLVLAACNSSEILAAAVLREHGITSAGLRRAVGHEFLRVVVPRNLDDARATVYFSTAAGSALEAAMESARRLGHGEAGTEHLLGVLLDADDSSIREILDQKEVDGDELRQRVSRALSPSKRATQGTGITWNLGIAINAAARSNAARAGLPVSLADLFVALTIFPCGWGSQMLGQFDLIAIRDPTPPGPVPTANAVSSKYVLDSLDETASRLTRTAGDLATLYGSHTTEPGHVLLALLAGGSSTGKRLRKVGVTEDLILQDRRKARLYPPDTKVRWYSAVESDLNRAIEGYVGDFDASGLTTDDLLAAIYSDEKWMQDSSPAVSERLAMLSDEEFESVFGRRMLPTTVARSASVYRRGELMDMAIDFSVVAFNLAAQRVDPTVEVDHLIVAILMKDDSYASQLLRALGVDEDRARLALAGRGRTTLIGRPSIGISVKEAIDAAVTFANMNGSSIARSSELLAGIASTERGNAILTELNVDPADLRVHSLNEVQDALGVRTRAADDLLRHADLIGAEAKSFVWDPSLLLAAILLQSPGAHSHSIEMLLANDLEPRKLFEALFNNVNYDSNTLELLSQKEPNRSHSGARHDVMGVAEAARAAAERLGDVAVDTGHLLIGLLVYYDEVGGSFDDWFFALGLSADQLYATAVDVRGRTSDRDRYDSSDIGSYSVRRGPSPTPPERLAEERPRSKSAILRRLARSDTPTGAEMNTPQQAWFARRWTLLITIGQLILTFALIYTVTEIADGKSWWLLAASFLASWDSSKAPAPITIALSSASVALSLLLGSPVLAALAIALSVFRFAILHHALVTRRRDVGDPKYGPRRLRFDTMASVLSIGNKGSGIRR